MCSLEFEFFNFAETPQSWAEKRGVGPEPITPGMFGYSLLRAGHARDYFNALFSSSPRSACPSGLPTETGPGVYEAAIVYSDALEARATARCCSRPAPGEIARASGSCRASWPSGTRRFPGCSGHVHQSLSDGSRNVFPRNPKTAGAPA